MSKALKACARRDVYQGKENHNVRYYFDRHHNFDAFGRTAHVASQPKLGLLSEWRAWLNPFDSDHPVTVGPVISGRNVCVKCRRWFKRF